MPPESSHNKGLITRRRFLIGTAAVAGAVTIEEAFRNGWFTDAEHAQEGHEHPNPEQLRQAKIRIRNSYRDRIRRLVEDGPEKTLTPAQLALLMRVLDIEEGCIDEGLVLQGKHKFGISGNASAHRGSELEEFTQSASKDREFMRRLKREWAHRRCAAQGGDDEAALAAAREMANRFGLTEDRVAIAGFGQDDVLRMQRDPHIHPGQGFMLDGSMQANEQAFGIPMLKISTKHVPPSYVGRQIGVVKDVLEGSEGMAEILEPGDPTFVVICGKTRAEIDQIIREQSGALDRFARRPVDIPVLVRA